MDLGRVIQLDVETRFKPHVIKEVYQQIGLHYREEIRRSNKMSLDPDGTAREELSNRSPYFYARNKMKDVGNAEPNLIYTGNAEQSLGVFNTDSGFEMYHTDGIVDGYMFLHETGNGNMPMRRQFPTTEDSDESFQKSNVEMVEEMLEEHLNKSRRIVVNG
jgi:hypothetical protein